MVYVVMLKFGNPYRPSGENNSRYVLSEGFMDLGNKVVVIGGYGRESINMLEVFDITKKPKVITFYESYRNRLVLWYTWLKKGVDLIKRLKPDIVISDGAIPVPKPNPYPLTIMRVHDVIKNTLKYSIPMLLLINNYKYIVFSSEYLKRDFISRFNVSKNKLRVIPLPVNTKLYRVYPLSKRRHAILFVNGRGRRNLPFVLKIFGSLAKLDKELELYIVGKVNVNTIASYHRLESNALKRVKVFGFLDRAKLRELYSLVKMLIIPTTYEGFGYPVIEASAAGTPVIGSTLIPHEVLIHGLNGFRLPLSETSIWLKHIIALLENDNLWHKMSRQARLHAEKFDVQVIALKYMKLLIGH